MKGVFDRIEDGGIAVILIEEEGWQFTVPVDELPAGSKVHAHFDVTVEDGVVTSIALEEEARISRENETESLLERLRSKKKGSRFKRD